MISKISWALPASVIAHVKYEFLNVLHRGLILSRCNVVSGNVSNVRFLRQPDELVKEKIVILLQLLMLVSLTTFSVVGKYEPIRSAIIPNCKLRVKRNVVYVCPQTRSLSRGSGVSSLRSWSSLQTWFTDFYAESTKIWKFRKKYLWFSTTTFHGGD